MNLFEELLAVLRKMNEEKIEYALCGGLALGLYGYPRLTKDIDLLVRGNDIERVKEAVLPLGFDIAALPMTFAAGTPGEVRVHRITKNLEKNPILLDLIEVEPSLAEVWSGRQRYTVEGNEIWAVSPEGLAEMKKRAGRTQDLADLELLEGKQDGRQAN